MPHARTPVIVIPLTHRELAQMWGRGREPRSQRMGAYYKGAWGANSATGYQTPAGQVRGWLCAVRSAVVRGAGNRILGGSVGIELPEIGLSI